MKEHCEINLKYHTIQAYQNIIKNHVKPRIGSYMLSQITTATLQEFVNNIYLEKGFSKKFEKNQNGSTHGRHLSGNAKTVWYFGTCKTKKMKY